MKRIFLLFSLLICAFFSNAQTDDKSKAIQLVTKHHEAIGITKDQLSNIKVSSTYYNEVAGTQMVYLLQTYKGLTVLNQMLVLAFKNEKLVSNAGTFITDIDKISNYQAASPSLSAKDAVKAAFAEAGIVKPTSLPKPISSDNGRKLDFGKQGAVTENITAELVWVPVEKGNQLSVKLAWQVQVVPADSQTGPFTVQAGPAQATALGTRYEVRLKDQSVVVVVAVGIHGLGEDFFRPLRGHSNPAQVRRLA